MSLAERSELWRKRFGELRTRILRREVAVFSFFLLLSFVFWFLNGLSKEMKGRIEYPVRYINFPEGKTLVNDLPDHLSLSVEGPGYSIVQTKLGGSREHLTIDLDRISIQVLEDREILKLYSLTYNLRAMLAEQIRTDFSINSISPDTIFFDMDRISRKKVMVIPDIEINTQRQYIVIGNISCDPDSIEVSGPRVIVDTLSAVYTRNYTFDQLNRTESKTLVLKPINRIAFSERKVEVNIPVEQFTEALLEVALKAVNVPDTALVRLFPDRVKVSCIVALSDYNNFMNAPLEAIVDMAGLDIASTSRLKVELRNLPVYAAQVRHNPQFVEYLIEKK